MLSVICFTHNLKKNFIEIGECSSKASKAQECLTCTRLKYLYIERRSKVIQNATQGTRMNRFLQSELATLFVLCDNSISENRSIESSSSNIISDSENHISHTVQTKGKWRLRPFARRLKEDTIMLNQCICNKDNLR